LWDDLHSRKGVSSCENVLLTIRGICRLILRDDPEGLLRSIEDELYTLSESGVHYALKKEDMVGEMLRLETNRRDIRDSICINLHSTMRAQNFRIASVICMAG
jgi:hypothetical protein